MLSFYPASFWPTQVVFAITGNILISNWALHTLFCCIQKVGGHIEPVQAKKGLPLNEDSSAYDFDAFEYALNNDKIGK